RLRPSRGRYGDVGRADGPVWSRVAVGGQLVGAVVAGENRMDWDRFGVCHRRLVTVGGRSRAQGRGRDRGGDDGGDGSAQQAPAGGSAAYGGVPVDPGYHGGPPLEESRGRKRRLVETR